jgi:hypothetical protein
MNVHLGDADHEPLTTKEGWARFVADDPKPPPELSREQWLALDEETRADHDEVRLDYHTRLAIVATPTICQVASTGRRLVLLNRHEVSARRGLIVTGPSGTGKTTAVTQLGRSYERAVRRRHPEEQARLPVVYVTVPPAATPRVLAVEFARFLGLPLSTRSNQAEVTNAVCGVLGDLRTELVIVDEIHNLNLGTRTGAEASDQLKYFSERMSATFVHAGIDVAGAGLFAGPRGRQIAGRFASLTTAPFPYGSTAQREQWQALVATLEQALCLHRHRPGDLLKLDAYLHERTDGMIGSLSHLVRGAAIEAILDGSEVITKATLESVRLDHAAEPAHRQRSKTRASSRQAS